MGIIKNKYVNKFISGGNTPAFPPSHTPGETVTTELPPEARFLASSEPPLPPGWFLQWEANAQKIYYLEQATGRTQWVRPNTSDVPNTQSVYQKEDKASILSGTTAYSTKPGNRLHRALQWRALPQQQRVQHSNIIMNLPTKAEREEILKEAAEKRKREGPPGPETFGQKTRRKFDEAQDFVGRSSIF